MMFTGLGEAPAEVDLGQPELRPRRNSNSIHDPLFERIVLFRFGCQLFRGLLVVFAQTAQRNFHFLAV